MDTKNPLDWVNFLRFFRQIKLPSQNLEAYQTSFLLATNMDNAAKEYPIGIDTWKNPW